MNKIKFDDHTEKNKYIQKYVFPKILLLILGLLFLLLGLILFVEALCHVLERISLFISVILMILGLALEVIYFKSMIIEWKALLQFVEETSAFIHKCEPPITPLDIVDTLRGEGFLVKEYPYGNYYCSLMLYKKCSYHFLVANNDTPDCKEAEEFSELFIRKIAETCCAVGSQYFVDFEYGTELESKIPKFIELTKKGFMLTEDNMILGFRIAYDTKINILYFAEAIKNIVWQKSEIIANYTNELFNKLFDLN